MHVCVNNSTIVAFGNNTDVVGYGKVGSKSLRLKNSVELGSYLVVQNDTDLTQEDILQHRRWWSVELVAQGVERTTSTNWRRNGNVYNPPKDQGRGKASTSVYIYMAGGEI